MNTEQIKELDPKETLKIDYEKLTRIIAQKGLSQERFSGMMGYAKGWFSLCKKRRTDLAAAKVLQMMAILEVDANEFVVDPEKKASKEADTTVCLDLADIEPSDFEKEVLGALSEIKQKLSSHNEILMYLFNEKQQKENEKMRAQEVKGIAEKEGEEEEKIDELDVSCRTLKSMLANRLGIKMNDYLETVKAAGVKNKKIAEAAVAKCGYLKKTTGYGTNKTLWIYKQDLQARR